MSRHCFTNISLASTNLQSYKHEVYNIVVSPLEAFGGLLSGTKCSVSQTTDSKDVILMAVLREIYKD